MSNYNRDVVFLNDSEIERRAEEVLKDCGIEDFPIDVDEVCDKKSVGVILIPGLKAQKGVDAYITGDFGKIYADYDCAMMENDSRYRFSMAHELGYMILHRPYYPTTINNLDDYNGLMKDFGSNKRAEFQANNFAGMLLCPRRELEKFTNEYFNCSFGEAVEKGNASEMGDFLMALCRKFGISKDAAMIRLKKTYGDFWK